MFSSVGLDIQSISGIKRYIEKGDNFINRVFTKDEIDYCNKYRKKEQHFAARWAAKEAFLKALGTGIQGCNLTDISIRHNKHGKPFLSLKGNAKKLINEMNYDIQLSLSHSDDYSAAVVLIINKKV